MSRSSRPQNCLLTSIEVARVAVLITVIEPLELCLANFRRMHHEARLQRHELSVLIALVDPPANKPGGTPLFVSRFRARDHVAG